MTRDGRGVRRQSLQGIICYNSYGHRNPQGLAWNAAGDLFIAEHGQSGHDEINLIKLGANYGWPVSGAKGDQEWLPVLHSGSDTWAPSGTTFADNKLLVAALAKRGLYALDASTGSMA